MAVTISVGDIMLVRPSFQITDQTDVAMNVLHYQVDSVGGTLPAFTSAMSQLAQGFYEQFGAVWSIAASEDVNLLSMGVQNIVPGPRSQMVSYSSFPQIAGEQESEPLPLQDCPTILKRTIYAEKWGLGRFYYCGLAESEQNSGIVNAGGMTSLIQMVSWLDNPITIEVSGVDVILRPVLIGPGDGGGVRVTPIIQAVMSNNVIKTQRRRRPGKGT